MPALKRWLNFVLVTMIAAPSAAGCRNSTTVAAPPDRVATPGPESPTLVTAEERRPGRWQQLELRGTPRRVDVYVARDDRPKPVLVLLHGSGCGPDVTGEPDGSLHETSVFQDAIEGALATVHVAIVERPGVDALVFPAGMSMSEKQIAFNQASVRCSDEFYANATKAARVDDAAAAIDAISREPWARRLTVAGHSEGTHVVTGLLRRPEVSGAIAAAGLFASAGPIPFFSG